MAVGFFEGELGKAQERFNAIYGGRSVCDHQVRSGLVMAISWMGVLKRRVDSAENRDLCRADIRELVRVRDLVNRVFRRIERELGERRIHGNAGDVAGGWKSAATRSRGIRQNSDLSDVR